jgi:hypothetical protein
VRTQQPQSNQVILEKPNGSRLLANQVATITSANNAEEIINFATANIAKSDPAEALEFLRHSNQIPSEAALSTILNEAGIEYAPENVAGEESRRELLKKLLIVPIR